MSRELVSELREALKSDGYPIFPDAGRKFVPLFYAAQKAADDMSVGWLDIRYPMFEIVRQLEDAVKTHPSTEASRLLREAEVLAKEVEKVEDDWARPIQNLLKYSGGAIPAGEKYDALYKKVDAFLEGLKKKK